MGRLCHPPQVSTTHPPGLPVWGLTGWGEEDGLPEGREDWYLWQRCFPALTPDPSSPSPFEVQVSPEAGAQKVRAWGPGLKTGQVGKSADFVVEAIGTEVGTLGKWLGGSKRECWGVVRWRDTGG